jgi:hypothetical protein
MTQRPGRRTLLALVLIIGLIGLPGLAKALQSGEVFSPASGHAQVIAQGVAALPPEAAWRTVFHSIAPGASGELGTDSTGFVLVDTGGVVVEDGDRATVLAPTEASFRGASAAHLVPIGERPTGLFAIDIVPAENADDAGGGIPVYASAPFTAPSGLRDIDLVRDLLEPGESTTVIGNEAPVLVLVTLGAIRAEATDGSSASLRVGEAATFSGDIVLSGEGQAPSTFVAAVIGREALISAGTPGATPAAAAVAGTVQATVYACPPLVTPQDASPGRCLRDPEAAALDLVALAEGAPEVGPSSERQGVPTWSGLRGGDYALRASQFKQGFARFVVRGLTGVDGEGGQGYPAGEDGGYLIPISADAADYSLEVYVLSQGEEGTPVAAAATAPASEPTATPGGPTEVPSVIQIETPVPGSEPTATPRPRATATPRPDPITRATAQATERPLVTSTAVARARSGTVEVRVWGCTESIESFELADCAQAVGGYELRLVSEDGEVIGQGDATIAGDGTVTWKNLPLGSYLFQQPVMLSGAVTYYAPNLVLGNDNSGYVVTIDRDEPVATIDVYNLPAPSAALAPTVSPAASSDSDSDSDDIVDSEETDLYGTDPLTADSDADGVLDGAEIAAGTDPLVPESAAPEEPSGDGDSDGDRLSDADEADFGTDPNFADSDGDGFYDGDEVNLSTDPIDGSSFP